MGVSLLSPSSRLATETGLVFSDVAMMLSYVTVPKRGAQSVMGLQEDSVVMVLRRYRAA